MRSAEVGAVSKINGRVSARSTRSQWTVRVGDAISNNAYKCGWACKQCRDRIEQYGPNGNKSIWLNDTYLGEIEGHYTVIYKVYSGLRPRVIRRRKVGRVGGR